MLVTFDTLKFVETLRAELRAIEPRLTIRLGGIVVIALGAFTALSKWIA
jgi:hypothetical protein